MAYDSAIAQATIETSNILPKEFVVKEYVNLVYDNIDFGEEIDKQSHVTNGIITQKVLVHQQLSSSDQQKKKQRTVEMPTSDIVPYSIGVKMTPTFHIVQLHVLVAVEARKARWRLILLSWQFNKLFDILLQIYVKSRKRWTKNLLNN